MRAVAKWIIQWGDVMMFITISIIMRRRIMSSSTQLVELRCTSTCRVSTRAQVLINLSVIIFLSHVLIKMMRVGDVVIIIISMSTI